MSRKPPKNVAPKRGGFRLIWQGTDRSGRLITAYARLTTYKDKESDITLRVLTHEAYPAPLFGAAVARSEDYETLNDWFDAERQVGKLIDQREWTNAPKFADMEPVREVADHPF